jgi:hypothetical protein
MAFHNETKNVWLDKFEKGDIFMLGNLLEFGLTSI